MHNQQWVRRVAAWLAGSFAECFSGRRGTTDWGWPQPYEVSDKSVAWLKQKGGGHSVLLAAPFSGKTQSTWSWTGRASGKRGLN